MGACAEDVIVPSMDGDLLAMRSNGALGSRCNVGAAVGMVSEGSCMSGR